MFLCGDSYHIIGVLGGGGGGGCTPDHGLIKKGHIRHLTGSYEWIIMLKRYLDMSYDHVTYTYNGPLTLNRAFHIFFQSDVINRLQ